MDDIKKEVVDTISGVIPNSQKRTLFDKVIDLVPFGSAAKYLGGMFFG